MGDIDIILSSHDREKAHEILINLGFTNTVHEDAEWEYQKGQIEVELHNQLEYEQLAKYKTQHLGKQRNIVLGKFRDMVFPSYQNMCVADHYAFLHGRRWLLPIAWIYRLYRGIALQKMNSVVTTMQEVKTCSNAKDEIDRRTAWLREWKI